MISLRVFRTAIRTLRKQTSVICDVDLFYFSNTVRHQFLVCLQLQRISSVRRMATSEKNEPCIQHVQKLNESAKFQSNDLGTSACSAASGLTTTDKHMHLKASPPPCVAGMKVLDKDKFLKKVIVQALPIPRKKLHLFAKYFEEWKFKECRVSLKGMDTEKEKGFKTIVFHPDKVTCFDDLGDDFKKHLIEADIDLSQWFEDEVELNFDSWKAKDILQAIIPQELGIVSGYSLIGHIIHLNLKEELLEFKYIIGQVLLDKHGYIRTVVNKLSTIDNTFRNFHMEILAGEDDTITTVRENGASFKFDFSKVYWNTRLGTEHARIALQLEKQDLMFDVFAGVGPFAVIAARRGVNVFANDLNPHSYESLVENLALNKVKTKVKCSNLDGRDFITSVMKPELLRLWDLGHMRVHKTYAVMNLPALAVTFLDEFIGLLSDRAGDQDTYPDHLIPLVHCYVFGKAADTRQAAKDLVEENIGESLPDDAKLKFVRNVAPNKDMYCVAFNFPKHLLFKSDGKTSTVKSHQSSEDEPPEDALPEDEPPEKRRKADDE
ncbi:tRNA (guanine(37)-N1)-methyltransferase-like [Ylistrum balloti]|uniref:tRNA (guanine(37)-N1)-methyltransferase-like n=1 Tax=Ylistrum balloti TaxID=509963 RepID=UPI002905D0AB|nr:tRNA (guanine(37)-N1)-methyltransferase-like [Ylistrum balloti]